MGWRGVVWRALLALGVFLLAFALIAGLVLARKHGTYGTVGEWAGALVTSAATFAAVWVAARFQRDADRRRDEGEQYADALKVIVAEVDVSDNGKNTTRKASTYDLQTIVHNYSTNPVRSVNLLLRWETADNAGDDHAPEAVVPLTTVLAPGEQFRVATNTLRLAPGRGRKMEWWGVEFVDVHGTKWRGEFTKTTASVVRVSDSGMTRRRGTR